MRTMSNQESNTQKALKGMSSQTLVTILLGIVEIGSFSIMSRLLTQEDFGYYAAISAIVVIFECFSTACIGSAVIQKKDASNQYINVAFTMSLILGIAIMALMMATAKPIARIVADESMFYPLILMATTLPLHCLTNINTSLMHRKLEFMKVGVVNLISLLITSIIAISLAYLGFSYYAIIARAVIGSVITCIISFILVKRRYQLEFEKKVFREIFSFSGWLTISVFFRNLSNQLDRLLMSSLMSVSALGAYNRPKEFITQISIKINGIFDTVLFPVLSDIQDDITKVKSAYKRSLYYMNIFSLLLACGFIFNSELIIRIFFGKEWMSVQSTFIIISLSLIFNIDGRLADCFFRSLGWTKQQFYIRILELILSIIGIIIGSKWGVDGIAISVLLVHIIIIFIKNAYIVGYIEVPINDFIGIILSSWRFSLLFVPLMLCVVFVLPHSLGANIFTVLFYVVLSIILFVFCPTLVGRQYKEDAYKHVKLLLNRLVSKHREL